MTVCPIDYRYGSEEMREIFSEEGKLRRMLLVEAALAESQAQVGMIPSEAAASIYRGTVTFTPFTTAAARSERASATSPGAVLRGT